MKTEQGTRNHTNSSQALQTPETDSLTPEELKELNRILNTEGFKREKLSQRQLLHLSRVGLHWDYLSPEQQRQVEIDNYAQKGLNPPPDGYRYNMQTSGLPVLDENGNAIIIKEDEPSIRKSFGGYLLNDSK